MSERKLLFLMSQEQALAFARLVEAAEAGSGDAACRLGDMYREGLGGLRYSPKETYRWYAKSALAGDANGQNNLGACYEHGLGCAQSYAKAVKWYRLSAAQGLNTASMNLGYCYLRGHGVAADKVEALRLFREAVERGEERAQQEVERLEGDLGVTRPTLVASGPRPVSVEACPRGHAVDPATLRSQLRCGPADSSLSRRSSQCDSPLGARIRLSLPHDGPLEQLRHSHAALAATDRQPADADRTESCIDRAKLPLDPIGTEAGADHRLPPRLGLGDVGSVPPPPWEDEELRLELLEVLSTETASPADGVDGPTEEELFPIFAEGGMRPEDLVEGVAERYRAYLERRSGRQ